MWDDPRTRKLMEGFYILSYNGKISNAAWDLDKVDMLGWNIIVDESDIYETYLSDFKIHGTAVLIRKLDNLIDEDDLKKSKKYFYSTIERIKNHLQLVFHRFIDEDNLKITLNGLCIDAWDPFVSNNPATQELSDEEIWDPDYKTCTYIQPFVLPHKTKFASEDEYESAGGYRGWSRHQGIYVYRNRRLIIYGTWFDLVRKEPAFNLARIKIDISSNADFDWKIDIKKSKASLPVYIREKVLVAVEDCTMRSTKVFNSRGSYTSHGNAAPNLDYVWEQSKKNGIYVYKINKKHPLLASIRKQLDNDGNEKLRAYLALIENFAPFMQNGILNTIDTSSYRNDQDKQKDLADIENYIKVYKDINFTNKEIIDTLSEIAMYDYLKEDIQKMVEGLDD